VVDGWALCIPTFRGPQAEEGHHALPLRGAERQAANELPLQNKVTAPKGICESQSFLEQPTGGANPQVVRAQM
jgi:hypothetical protein